MPTIAMKTKRCGLPVLILLGAALGLPVSAPAQEDEGVAIGVVQAVERAGGYVVIDDRRYRTRGLKVKPPRDVTAEDNAYRTRPFREGMIVRFTVEPGQPPAIKEAWALD